MVLLDLRTYRLGVDLVIGGARGGADLTVGSARVDLDRRGQSEVWLPGEAQDLGGIRVRLSQRDDVADADAETGLPPLTVFMVQLEEILRLVTARRGIQMYLFVIQLRRLPELRALYGRPNVALELGKLAQRLADVEGVTLRGRLTDAELAVVCSRPTCEFEKVRAEVEQACLAAEFDFQARITGRAFQPHPTLFSALALDSCRPEMLEEPRVHRPLPEHH